MARPVLEGYTGELPAYKSPRDQAWEKLVAAYEAARRGERAYLQGMVQYIDPESRLIWIDMGCPERVAVMGWHEFDAYRELTEEQLIGWIGRLISFKVVKLYEDPETGEKYAICSRRAFQEEAGQDFFGHYKVGDIVETVVRGFAPNAVFTSLPGGVTGVIPIGELEDKYTEKVEDVVSKGDLLHAKILEMQPEKGRAILSVRQTYQVPWEKVTNELRPGGVAFAEVVHVRPDSNVVLLRLSIGLLAAAQRPNHLDIQQGDWCRVRIARINSAKRRIYVRLMGLMRERPQPVVS